MTYLRIMILMLCLTTLNGCTSQDIAIHFLPSQSINSTTEHKELPLEIKLYQLSSAEVFKRASFNELWLKDQQVLGSSLLHKTIVVIKPGMNRTVDLQKVSHAKYLGIVAIYHNKPKGAWQLVMPMPSGMLFIPGSVSIKVTSGSLENL